MGQALPKPALRPFLSEDTPVLAAIFVAAIEELTGERLGAGSLYGALTRLEAKGLVESLEAQGRQRPVRLTADGRAVLEKELRAAVGAPIYSGTNEMQRIRIASMLGLIRPGWKSF